MSATPGIHGVRRPHDLLQTQRQTQADECAICLEAIVFRGGKAIFDPGCGHRFHFSCLKSAFQAGNQECPMCRGRIQQHPTFQKQSSAPPAAFPVSVAAAILAAAPAVAPRLAASTTQLSLATPHLDAVPAPRSPTRAAAAVLGSPRGPSPLGPSGSPRGSPAPAGGSTSPRSGGGSPRTGGGSPRTTSGGGSPRTTTGGGRGSPRAGSTSPPGAHHSGGRRRSRGGRGGAPPVHVAHATPSGPPPPYTGYAPATTFPAGAYPPGSFPYAMPPGGFPTVTGGPYGAYYPGGPVPPPGAYGMGMHPAPFSPPSRSARDRTGIVRPVTPVDNDDDIIEYPKVAPVHRDGGTPDIALFALPEVPSAVAGQSAALSALVSIVAPALSHSDRVPIDLVAVLDKSGSMMGTKIQLLCDTLKFCTEQLAATDRLSIITFDHAARRELKLRRMDGEGKTDAFRAIGSLVAGGGTSIAAGLNRALTVLESRRVKAPVTAVLLLSDGQDSLTEAEVSTFRSRFGKVGAVTHTFGFGADHDAVLLNRISDAGRGNFTYIDVLSTVRTAFAGCIGGLLSVAAQNVRLTIEACNGARITSVHAGYPQSQDAGVFSLVFSDLFSEERRDVLVDLVLPPALAPASLPEREALSLIYLRSTCAYTRVTAGGSEAGTACALEIARPEHIGVAAAPNVTVDIQRNRYLTTDTLRDALAQSEANNFRSAQKIIDETVAVIRKSASAMDPVCQALVSDLVTARSGFIDRTSMESGGRAQCLQFSGSHLQQRSYAQQSPYQVSAIIQMQAASMGASY